jgi:ribosomal protein S28E/S33
VPTIIEMEGVRGGDTDFPVQLYEVDDTGRLVVRVINEGGYACTDLDLVFT